MFSNSRQTAGFSLLEVIIATAILAASGMMLMSIFSTGDRHTRRADERTIAQMLCQTKLEELLLTPSLIVPIEADIDPQFPGWIYSITVVPTQFDGFVQLTVGVSRIPGMPTGADLELASKSTDEQPEIPTLTNLPTEPTFQLVRWLPYDGDVTGFSDSAAPASRFGTGGL